MSVSNKQWHNKELTNTPHQLPAITTSSWQNQPHIVLIVGQWGGIHTSIFKLRWGFVVWCFPADCLWWHAKDFYLEFTPTQDSNTNVRGTTKGRPLHALHEKEVPSLEKASRIWWGFYSSISRRRGLHWPMQTQIHTTIICSLPAIILNKCKLETQSSNTPQKCSFYYTPIYIYI